MRRTARSRDLTVERLTWTLLAAISGISAGMTACSGRSERHAAPEAEAGEGGTGGRGGSTSSGGTSGNGTGGTGNVSATGGTSSVAGRSASGGTSTAGTGALAGSAGSGAEGGTGAQGGTASGGNGGEPPSGCAAAGPRGELEQCAGPFVHRPTVSACALPERTGPGEAGAGGQAGGGGTGGTDMLPLEHLCDTDLDCDEQPNGYCTVDEASMIGPQRVCNYACSEDADCGTGEICACGDPSVNASGETILLGHCRPATCASDADCGGGALCISPVDGHCGPTHPSSFHCQLPDDECNGPADCAPFEFCAHDGARFVCQERPTCGRPFLVHGAARVAREAAGGAWADRTLSASAAPLSDEERAEIARYYVQAGLMEHASIAAFARFSLQLLALGAPAELVADATTAMQDETRHAQLCFGLAARYGRDVGPGPLDLAGSLAEVDLLSIAELVITEGCIGETCAALEAAWAADAAEAPELRSILAGIAEDELRHAALAFRFVAWASQRDPRIPALLVRRVEEARSATVTAAAAELATSTALARHGVLDSRTRAEARRRALEDIVGCAARALTGRAADGSFHVVDDRRVAAEQ